MFNWFKNKDLTPEMVFEILKADAEKATMEYVFEGETYDLPIVTADDDFLEFLQEESMGYEIDINEAAELFGIWMAENCQ
jgi:hypothetical protein